jgi:hypothetical protein
LSIFWVHISSRETFLKSYQDIALRIPQFFVKRHKQLHGRENFKGLQIQSSDKAQTLRLVRDWLQNSESGQWFMILDNADDIQLFDTEDETNSSLLSAIPDSEKGSILVTSRTATVARMLVDRENCLVHVSEMSSDEAFLLIKKRLPEDNSDNEDVVTLARELDHLPLAIRQATAYIIASPTNGTVSQYLKLFRKNEVTQRRLLEREYGDRTRADDLKNSVILTWQISFEMIFLQRPSAANILYFISCIGPEAIPLSLLQTLQEDEFDFDDDLSPLIHFSFLELDKASQMVSMHRLVQLTGRLWLSKLGQEAVWQTTAFKTVNEVFASAMQKIHGRRNVLACRSLLGHANFVLQYATKLETRISEEERRVLSVNVASFNDLPLQWLRSESVHMQKTFEKNLEGVGEWLLASPVYSDWLNSPDRPLWLYGPIGCGKTHLM